MAFHKKTVKDIDLKGKRVLLRADYNVPIEDGKITDDYRIDKSLPTIRYLLEKGCSIVICSHLGRPKHKDDSAASLKPVAKRLGKLLDREVKFCAAAVGDEAEKAANELQPGQILLLENLRYYPEEEAGDKAFAEKLASLGEVFVQDAFGVVHRAHASLTGVPKFLPAVAGLLVEHEVDVISRVMEAPERPLMAIIGGAKISDKIDILDRFIEVADFVAVGGAMANTFLLAEGIQIGKSVAEPEEVPLAKEIIERARARSKRQKLIFYLPQDGVVASRVDKTARTRIVDWDAHVFASVESYPKRPARDTAEVADNEKILDIGPFSGAFISGGMQMAKTVIWNGAMGVTETPSLQGPVGPFAHGTDMIVRAMLGEYGNKPFSVVGGGDTVGFIEERGLTSAFGHVSTGGGASMELMSGKSLPGVDALLDKDS